MRIPVTARFAVVLAALFGSIACGATTTPTEPDPVYELKTSNFTGTIKTGGTVSFPFTVVNPGDISVSIAALSPVSTLTMGVGLGSWDAAAEACTPQRTTNSATLNVVFSASPSAAGEYCVGIFDVGNVQDSSDFELKVTYY